MYAKNLTDRARSVPVTMPTLSPDFLHLGYNAVELEHSPYARFFSANLAPLPEHVGEALLIGAVADELLPSVDRANELLDDGSWPVETGYSISPDGAARVFVRTEMPGVTPAMWDWWFAWHGSEVQRYKLWHPRAHLHVGWEDGRDDLDYYIGRRSNVVEFVGSTRLALTIDFLAPESLGIDESRLKASGATAICARGGLAGAPVETAWLVHHVRPVAGGSEMRSRFWLAGSNVRPRGMPGKFGALIGRMASRLQPFTSNQAAELLVHCAQEMNHLACVLPQIYAAFGPHKLAEDGSDNLQ